MELQKRRIIFIKTVEKNPFYHFHIISIESKMLQNIGGSSKQLFIGAKDPISRFEDRFKNLLPIQKNRLLQGNNAETKYDTKPNGGAAGGGSYEMDGMQSGGSSKRQSHIDESLQIHSNIILKVTNY